MGDVLVAKHLEAIGRLGGYAFVAFQSTARIGPQVAEFFVAMISDALRQVC